jgi:uncharacterized protein YbjT (DUF2867 family)
MVLVIGATGDLGSQVVRALRSAGAPVRCLIRQGSPYFWLNDTGADYFFGDLREPDTLRRACDGVRWVVSCAGLRTEGRGSNHDTVTRAGHQALWQAAQAAGVERAVYVSCLGTGRIPDSPAHLARAEAEAALRDSGLEHTILRPSLFASTFALAARYGAEHGWVPMLGAGGNPVSPIGVHDLALAVVASLDLPGLRDQVVELGGPRVMTYREALEQALAAAGAPNASLRPVPRLLRGAGLPLLGRVQPRWSTRLRELEAHATQDLSVAAGAFEAAFGWEPAPFDRALALALAAEPRPENIIELYPLMQHRGPQATAYEAGTKPISELPEGPPAAR